MQLRHKSYEASAEQDYCYKYMIIKSQPRPVVSKLLPITHNLNFIKLSQL